MVKAEFIPIQEIKKIDLCQTCANADTCEFVNHKHKAVWECELFRLKEESEPKVQIA